MYMTFGHIEHEVGLLWEILFSFMIPTISHHMIILIQMFIAKQTSHDQNIFMAICHTTF